MKGRGKKARKAAAGRVRPRPAAESDPSTPAAGERQSERQPAQSPPAGQESIAAARREAAREALEVLDSLSRAQSDSPSGAPPGADEENWPGYTDEDLTRVGRPLAHHLDRHTAAQLEDRERAGDAHRRMREEFVATTDERLAAQTGEVQSPERAVELALIEEGYLAARREERAAEERLMEVRRREAIALLGEIRPMGASQPQAEPEDEAADSGIELSQSWANNSERKAVEACESALAHFPTEWIEHSALCSPLKAVCTDSRAYYDIGARDYTDISRAISVPAGQGLHEVTVRRDAVHELSHRFEEVRPHLVTLGRQFRERRQAAHGPDGGFANAHASHAYEHGRVTEVLSCGLAELFMGGDESSPPQRERAGLHEDAEFEAFLLGTAASA